MKYKYELAKRRTEYLKNFMTEEKDKIERENRLYLVVDLKKGYNRQEKKSNKRKKK